MHLWRSQDCIVYETRIHDKKGPLKAQGSFKTLSQESPVLLRNFGIRSAYRETTRRKVANFRNPRNLSDAIARVAPRVGESEIFRLRRRVPGKGDFCEFRVTGIVFRIVEQYRRNDYRLSCACIRVRAHGVCAFLTRLLDSGQLLAIIAGWIAPLHHSLQEDTLAKQYT